MEVVSLGLPLHFRQPDVHLDGLSGGQDTSKVLLRTVQTLPVMGRGREMAAEAVASRKVRRVTIGVSDMCKDDHFLNMEALGCRSLQPWMIAW